MSVAPAQRPVAAREHAMPVAGFQRPPRRGWDGPARMVELVLELAAPRDVRDRGIAGVALHGRRRDRAAALELAGRRPRDPRQGVEAGPDDQLRPRAGPVAPTASSLQAELDQRVVLALAVAALVVLDRLHEGRQRGPDRGA